MSATRREFNLSTLALLGAAAAPGAGTGATVDGISIAHPPHTYYSSKG